MRGVKFGRYHSFDSWGLYLATYPSVSPPEPAFAFVDVPGADAPLDLSQALDGRMHYGQRSLTFKFLCIAPRNKWGTIYRKITNAIHGQSMQVSIDDEPDWSYWGRVTVGVPSYGRRDFTMEINMLAEPYKYEMQSTAEPWLWKPFNFETGIIRDYDNLQVSGTLEQTVHGWEQPVKPSVRVQTAQDLTVSIRGKTYTLPGGTTTALEYELVGTGGEAWTFSGEGVIDIIMRGKSL